MNGYEQAQRDLSAAIEKFYVAVNGALDTGEMVTHWVVSAAMYKVDGETESSMVSQLHSAGLTFWQARGLVESSADYYRYNSVHGSDGGEI